MSRNTLTCGLYAITDEQLTAPAQLEHAVREESRVQRDRCVVARRTDVVVHHRDRAQRRHVHVDPRVRHELAIQDRVLIRDVGTNDLHARPLGHHAADRDV